MDTRRTILLLALAFISVLLYQRWLIFQAPETPPATRQTAGVQADEPEGKSRAGGGDAAPAIPAGPRATSASAAAGTGEAAGMTAADPPDKHEPAAGGSRIEVVTDVYRATIDPNGGGIENLALLKHSASAAHPDQPFLMMKRERTTDGLEIFVAESGLIGEGREFPNHRTRYTFDRSRYELREGVDTVKVDLHWAAPDGVRYTKRFTFARDSYDIKVDFLVDNESTTPWSGYVYGQLKRTHTVPHRSFIQRRLPVYTGAAIYSSENEFEKVSYEDMEKGPLKRTVAGGWVAMLRHYFDGAWVPRDNTEYAFYSHVGHGENPLYSIGLNSLQPVTIVPGDVGQLGFDLYAGPKEQNRLTTTAPGLDLTIDYGWLTPISVPIFWVLDHIHDLVGNWGWSIILLTCLIKLLFFPLSATSYKSMAKMKKLQPTLKNLKERYGDDRAKFHQAMMQIYKKERVNPLGGCLPIVVQIPVFISLYWVLLESVELRQAPWELWILDLSSRDPYYVLPILMGASMLAQQLLNPSPVDPMQKKIMMALPLFFTVLFLYFPAGLVLYWLTNNTLSIAQQRYANSRFA